MQQIHIAIIPDGNRRWARSYGKHELEGTKYAADHTLPQIIDCLIDLKIKYFTFWAMSTENFNKRSKQEINHLVNLIRIALRDKTDEYHKKNIRLRIIGDISRFPDDVQKLAKLSEEKTKNNTGLYVQMALNYGGRDELLRAIAKICQNKNHEVEVTKESISNLLDTAGIPDPDLIIRFGGEKRLSGFMLWQCEYSELYFDNAFFPSVTADKLRSIINKFKRRSRRYGK